jgi:hypothetical protein
MLLFFLLLRKKDFYGKRHVGMSKKLQISSLLSPSFAFFFDFSFTASHILQINVLFRFSCFGREFSALWESAEVEFNYKKILTVKKFKIFQIFFCRYFSNFK